MSFMALPLKQGLIIFQVLLYSLTFALPSDLSPRADVDPCLNEASTLDGPTSDQSAGLGVEFESVGVVFNSPACSEQDTNQAKGQQVGDRSGTNWILTADTTLEMATRLTAEYILNGQKIKIGTGAASAAAAAVSGDIMAWNPYSGMPDNRWNIEGNNCNPWAIITPSTGGGAGNLMWAVQATGPLPLEAINDLFVAALNPSPSNTSPLLPVSVSQLGKNMISVNQQFFQSKPNGISADSVKADVLGFLSLVISYIKLAGPTSPAFYATRSPKFTISIMPRTDFATLYIQVKAALPGSDTLYNLVKILACYKNDGSNVDLDSRFCDGSVAAPQPNSYMDSIGWCLRYVDSNEQGCLKVSDWIASIASDPSPDKLTTLDKLIDGSVGGFGNALENVVGTTRAVPMFEFRNLVGINAGQMQGFVTNVENAIISFHNKYKSPPSRKMIKRNGKWHVNKRQNDQYGCPTTIAPLVAVPTCTLQKEDPDQGIEGNGCICGSTTLPLLNVPSATNPSQSCAYTALPSTTGGVNPISVVTTTYTSACQACTLVGGIADTPTCTAIAGCATSTRPPPPPATPAAPAAPVCSAGSYGTDTTCGGKCNGPKANCECIEAGYRTSNNACTCTC